MLRHRLIFGTLMTFVFIGIVLLDGWLDGSLTASAGDDKSVRGTLLVILVAILMVPGLLELSKLASAKGAKILLPISIPVSVLVVSSWYWFQFTGYGSRVTGYLLLAFSVMACFLYQRIRYGITGVLVNCGAACFSILYLGLLGCFIPAVRIVFGPWHLLMLIFVVKCSDIGAYTAGCLWGKHKFSPLISPQKTWEGMIGAVTAAVIVAVAFAIACDIMAWWLGILFGIGFAFIGQLGDLAESMLKRDAEKKDASNNVPGFGGILDVVDSVLVSAPFGYLFFSVLGR
jgi:phosphatidate cytidylyltransferase